MSKTYVAVKAQQGKILYYTTQLSFREVERYVMDARTFQKSPLLEGIPEMQRDLNMGRVNREMVPYLLNNEDAFFSAITLIVMPRDPHGLPEPDEDYFFVPFEGLKPSGRVGLLHVGEDCVLFPADGQHRVAAIKEALRRDDSLKNNTIAAVLIPFESPEQVRQTFSDLNRYAKVPSKTISLDFDTRDPAVSVSKALIERVEVFTDRVNRRTNTLSKTSNNVITLNALHECTLQLLAGFYGDLKVSELSAKLINDDGDGVNEEAVELLAKAWDVILDNLPEARDIPATTDKVTLVTEDGTEEVVFPTYLRETYVYPHGIGWQAIAHAAKVVIRTCGDDWDTALGEALDGIVWRRDNPEWNNVAMVGDRINNTSSGIKAAAGFILTRVDIPEPAVSSALVQGYAGALASARAQAGAAGDGGDDFEDIFA